MVMKRVGVASKSKIDPMFYIPDGVQDLEYTSEIVEDEEVVDEDEDEEEPLPPKPPTKKDDKNSPKAPKKKPKAKKKKPAPKKKQKGEPNKNQRLGTPKSLVIVSQKIITKPDGGQVVDIVVDVDKIMKADKYEFRITNKATGKTTVIGG